VTALAGRRVLVTRARAQAAELVRSLEAAGAVAIVAPTISIVPPDDPAPLAEAAAHLDRFDWIVFASANAVDALLDAAAIGGRPVPDLTGKVCAVGSRTAERLRERGVAVGLVPSEFRAEALVDALEATSRVRDAHVLVPRADIGQPITADRLRRAGAQVTDVIAYRTVPDSPGPDAPDVRAMLAAGALDAVTFTSGSAVQNFIRLYGDESAGLLRSTIVAVIGPVTGDAARDAGIRVDVQPATSTTAAMVDELQRYFEARATD
jgi:uroporphyrinogen III methyltransferase/synthase